MSTCAVKDCTDPAEGPLIYKGRYLADLCEVHALALGCDQLERGDTSEPAAPVFLLNPARAAGWVLSMRLDLPGPVLEFVELTT